ncbi:MAG TPA: hemerythrin family protein [Gammaproteobacteria bacterium]|nr:hemerythrin family protein [Gammaproteobacteria bacterium]
MPELIESFDAHYRLGIPQMDATHREFVDLVNRLGESGKAGFLCRFEELVRHTEDHFSAENALMQESGFPAIREHMDEHRRVQGDLQRLLARVEAGSTVLAHAYVIEQLPPWFRLHAVTMDSALAAHLGQAAAGQTARA